jgi:hypothetical protein
MTTHTAHPTSAVVDAPARRGMTPSRRIALWGGVLYLITFVASIPQLATYKALIDDPTGYVRGTGSDSAVQVGSWLEVVTALAGVGTAVALYRITRRVSRTAAIGFVATRVVEAGVIVVGAVCMLAVVTLHGQFAGATGAEATSVGVTSEALVAMRQWTFLLGPGILPAFNAFFLATVMYRSGLVHRLIPTIGLVGAPLLLASTTVTLFGGWSQVSGPATLLALPIATWELSLGVYLTVKGFRRTPVTEAVDAEPPVEVALAA